MRFRTELKNIRTFLSEKISPLPKIQPPLSNQTTDVAPELTAALSSLEKIAWMRLSDDTARFTVIPDMGSQVWA